MREGLLYELGYMTEMYQNTQLSIIIPLYNTEKYIYQCLESVSQYHDLSAYEIIVVDDGSTDQSLAIVEEFSAIRPNFRIIRQSNKGVSSARMSGVSIAKGSYVWFVDSDDYLLPGAINTVLRLLEECSQVDVLVIQMLLYDDKTGDSRISPFAPAPERFISGREYLQRRPLCICPVQFIIKRGMFVNPDIRFPEGLRREDEYFSRVLQYNSTLMYISEEPLYVYRQRSGSYMRTNTIQPLYDMVEIYKLLSDFVEKKTDIADRVWLQRDIFSFLVSSYFWFPEMIPTAEFREFHNNNKRFIRKELRKSTKILPLRNLWRDVFMLYAPQIFSRLIKYKYRLRNKIRNDS